LTYGIPKPLLPVGGKPVIDYVIDNLMTAKEITTIYVAVSHMENTIRSYFVHTPRNKVSIETITTLGWETAGDLKIVAIEKGIDEPIVVAYGDNVTNINIAKMIEFHKKKDRKATIALFKVPKAEVGRFGIAKMEDNFITEFVEKPSKGISSNLANAGYYVIEPEVISMLPDKKIKMEELIFPKLAKERELVGFVYHPKYWLDIGTLEAYRKANRMMEGILPP